MKPENTQISIVATLYSSSPYIEAFYQRITATLQKIGVQSHEIIFIDDGSPDNSLQIAVGLMDRDPCIKIVELSRNFGHHKAMMIGLEAAVGDTVFLIDVDLEESPELLEPFWLALHDEKNGAVDVIYGVQESRKGGWLERHSGWYYKLFNMLADEVKVEPNLSTIRLMKRHYVEQLMKFKEHEFYLGPVLALVGFKQIPLRINKLAHSESTYHFFKKYNLFINSIFAFSKKPLYFIFYFGLLMTLIAFVIGSGIVVRRLFYGQVLDGWTSIMVSIWFLGGIMILFLGVIAIYLAKVFEQTKHRPFAVIKRVYQRDRAS